MSVDHTKVRFKHIRDSVMALVHEWLYGDGWRIVEVIIGIWVFLRGIAIIFLGGMDADYYSSFPMREDTIMWGMVAIAIGVGRIAGTIINGSWQRSPRLRWTAGVAGVTYQLMHLAIFASLGLTLIALAYAFWMVLDALGVGRSTVDIIRKRELAQCRNG